MTTLKRTLIATSLAAAGLLGAGMAQAAAPDVSTIYGRGSPPNVHITSAEKNLHAARESTASQSTTQDSDSTYQETVRSGAANTDTDGRAPATASAESGGEYLSSSTTATTTSDTVTTPTGEYLVVDEATRPERFEMAAIHNENIDGTPLVDGRGMREGYDLHAGAPVYTDPAFDVSEVLGRASPPAPENAPAFGIHT